MNATVEALAKTRDKMTKPKPTLLKHKDWVTEKNRWAGRIEGKDLGTNMTVLFFSTDKVGNGPRLHVHRYDELFVIREGRARFIVGDDEFVAEAGDVVFGPAEIPHKFANLGPGRLETMDIHLSDHFEQVDLE